MCRHAILALLSACLLSTLALAAGVESFSPQGEVKGVRQVSVRFDVDMVPLGDPRLADPFNVDCLAKGKGRWVDNRNWVYDFEQDLPAGVKCGFTLIDGSKSLTGEKLAPAGFSFTTGGPAILTTIPSEGEQISEDQVFVLGLDAPVREASLPGHFWCEAEGVAEKIPAQLITGKDKAKVLAASETFFQGYLQVLAVHHSLYLLDVPSGSRRETLLRAAAKPGAPVLVARCGRRLPADHAVSLVWETGIESSTGIATSSEQTVAFKTRPDFSARLHCEKLNPRQPCLPVLPMRLDFSAPVDVKAAARIRLSSEKSSWHGKISDEDNKSGYTQSLSFAGPFPEATDLTLTLPAMLKDQDGRSLVNAASFPLKLKTDLAPPLAKFASDFGIYELNAQPALPLTIRYVDTLTQRHARFSAERLITQNPIEIIEWMRRIRERSVNEYGERDEKTGYAPIVHFGAEESIFEDRHKIKPLQLPKPLPDKETEVIGIPLPGAGFHIVEVASPRLGAALMDKPKPYYVRATALVSNMAIHFKRGDESSLVWVTSLDSGQPVADAEVAVRDCANAIYAKGRTDADGIVRINKALPEESALPGCLDKYDREFFVTAAKSGDFSFLLSDWGSGISPWRFNLYQDKWQGPYVAHAVLDRSLFRPGEDVAMKLFVRRKKSVGFGYVDPSKLGNEVILRHQGSGEEVKLPVNWDSQGIAELKYTLPKEAKQGRYDILIPHQLRGQNHDQLSAGEFRVASYRVPTVRARLSGPGQVVNASEIALDMQAEYLAGGAASGMPVTLRGQLQAYDTHFADYEDATFANGRVHAGRQDEQAEWVIGDYETNEEMPAPTAGVVPLKTLKFKLDAGGSARNGWRDLPHSDTPHVLQTEAEYRDANGETRSAATRVTIFPSRLLIGVQPDSWVQARTQQRFRIIALDTAGKPMANVAVQGHLYQRNWYSYRKRVIGGFYAFEHGAEIKPLAETCAGRTDERGLFFCETHSAATGSLIFEAEAHDEQNNPSYAQCDFWVPEGDSWVDSSDNDRMDLIPERRHYEIGDTARFHLRMPFPAARVLVSVEREGVLDAWVTEVKRDNPVIEVPIKPEYGPNIFVSALAVRGRVGDVQPTATIDLGKPAYRMGVAEIQAGWSGYALKVSLDTDKRSYHTREKVRVRVKVRRPDGSLPGKGAEIALVAVDEGLLELAPNPSWKLLDAMMQRRGIAVTTSTGQMQVVGKRHFGRKAVATGGGGGTASGPARELFDTRIFWRARVKLDDQGEAQLEVPLNDSLTRFRIVAVANVNVGRFGSGETDVAVTQDLQILSGAAPLVREGDRLKVYFTVRNTSTRSMDMDLSPRLNGQALSVRSEHLEPGQGREIALPVEVPFSVSQLDWELDAHERGGEARDRLRIRQQVKEAVPVRTFQATLAQLAEPLNVPVSRPADAIPGRGGIGLKFQARLAGDLAGVREYMNYYPWTCLEQQTSQAIALEDAARWQAIAASLPAYLDHDGLLKYWPDLPQGSDTLTAYLLAVSAEAGYAIPDGSRTRMVEGLRGFIEGRVLRDSALHTADLAVRKLAAMEALSRYKEVQIQTNWLDSFSLTPNLWPTSAVIDWVNVLERSPQLPARDQRLQEARTILRARLNFSGTVMGFSTERSDYWWWLMVNGDSNANRMTLEALDDSTWSAADLGRLMRGSLARQQHGHWNTTVANAWGVLATRRFSQKLESQVVTGITEAGLGEETERQDWSKDHGGTALLPWPNGPQLLNITHQGQGKPWVTVSSLAAIPLKQPLNAGYRIQREIQPIEQREAGVWHRGDVLRVRLTVDAQTDMGWVALLDPIPSGATILGTGLGGDSALLAQGEKRQGWVWPAYEERTHDSFRAYYNFVPKGQFMVEYTLRLNNEGHFSLPAARAEAMYAPELSGEMPVADMDVKP
ncbi:MAG: MG2 domain-containing protein [Thiobacillaceae bacterium]